jgi:hypothetical protein
MPGEPRLATITLNRGSERPHQALCSPVHRGNVYMLISAWLATISAATCGQNNSTSSAEFVESGGATAALAQRPRLLIVRSPLFGHTHRTGQYGGRRGKRLKNRFWRCFWQQRQDVFTTLRNPRSSRRRSVQQSQRPCLWFTLCSTRYQSINALV